MPNDTRDIDHLARQAVELHRAGRLDEAAALYRDILAREPAHAAVLQNLGVIAASQGDHGAAVARFDDALAADPRSLPAHLYRAISLQALGQVDAAIGGFQQVCRMDPGHYAAHRALGFLWLAKGESGRALDHFTRTSELRRGADRGGLAEASLSRATRAKLAHDAAQFRYLADLGRDRARFETLAQVYEQAAEGFPETARELTAAETELLGDSYNTAIHHHDAPEQPGPVLTDQPSRPAGAGALDPAGPGVLVIDDFLTPAALDSLWTYLLRSTIWHDFSHIEGHVASYLEDGLACPLLLQIAAAIRAAHPELLGAHPLSQAWAFKGLEAGAAIGAHADDAVISVNFWLTPDEANLGRGEGSGEDGEKGGGMTVCRKPPPADWAMADYDEDRRRSDEFLARHEPDCVTVPYRRNRAVIFASRLIHRSDAPHFAPGYENHRINITLLYGRSGPGPGNSLK